MILYILAKVLLNLYRQQYVECPRKPSYLTTKAITGALRAPVGAAEGRAYAFVVKNLMVLCLGHSTYGQLWPPQGVPAVEPAHFVIKSQRTYLATPHINLPD